VKVSLDRNTYRPGQEARLQFAVTDARGLPAPSALGVDIVDESLFALSERRPGMERIKNLVPDELLRAPFTIGGATLPDLIALAGEARSQTFSRLILAKVPPQGGYSVNRDTYAARSQDLQERLARVFQSTQAYYASKKEYPKSVRDLVDAQLLRESHAKDPWGRFFVIRTPKEGNRPGIPAQFAYKAYCAPASSTPGATAGIHRTHADVIEAPPPLHEGKVRRVAPPVLVRGMAGNGEAPPLPLLDEKEITPHLDPVVQVLDASRPDVLCLGADGVEGTADDYGLRAAVIAGLPLYYARAAQAYAYGNESRRYKSLARSDMEGAPPAMMAEKAAGGAVPQAVLPNAPAAKRDTTGAPAEPVRIRDFFPETLISRPELITDGRGMAIMELSMADSITTWRVAASANSLKGQLGSTSSGIKVFQDFFIDLNLPVRLTQGDEVSIPVAVYNYLPGAQTVSLSLEKMPWFELREGDASRRLDMGKDEVKAVNFRIRAKTPGLHKLTVTARGSSLSDAISRTIEVEPDGKKFILSKSSVLKSPGTVTAVNIPQGAVPGGSTMLLTLYPSPLSSIVQGMDTIFRVPSGCFEQTSSATYPNVLVLDYLKGSRAVKPDVEKKAKDYINQGYQKLLSYEIPGGGFQVWGQAPATRVLSAYGLMEMSDMSRVSNVDPAVLTRTKGWLLSQRNQDGSWSPDANFAHAEQWGTIQSENIPTTAYITWALAESGCRNEIAPSIAYLKKNLGQVNNPYILGLCANAFLSVNPQDGEGRKLLETLARKAVSKDGALHWEQKQSLYSQGDVASVEATALIVYGMMKSRSHPDVAKKGLAYIVKSRDSNGLWASTQATIFAMRALLRQQLDEGTGSDFAGQVIVNGRRAGNFTITKNNYDVFQQLELKNHTREGNNTIEIATADGGGCTFQLTGIYYMPWNRKEAARRKELGLTVEYDRKEVKAQESVTCSFEAKNLRDSRAPMVMVEVGTPPGFDVMTDDLDAMVANKTVQKYETARGKVIIYLDGIEKKGTFKGSYRLVARYPMKAKTPVSSAYLYYNPEVNCLAEPVILKVI